MSKILGLRGGRECRVLLVKVMSGHDVIVIGGSAGALEPLRLLLQGLPADIPAAVFVVLHMPPQPRTSVPQPIARGLPQEVRFARNGERIAAGTVLLAPPDQHLILADGRVHLSRGPRENYWRPAIDVLFRTAAVECGSRVAAVLLSGALDDGVAGLHAVTRCRGKAFVQSPEEASYPQLPELARRNVNGVEALPVREIAARLASLAHEAPEAAIETPEDLRVEARVAMHGDRASALSAYEDGEPSSFTCPECNGPLSRAGDGLLRFRCKVGHAYGGDTLGERTRQQIEASLWSAVRLLQQRATLERASAEREIALGRKRGAAIYSERADENEGHAALLRELMLSLDDASVLSGDPGS